MQTESIRKCSLCFVTESEVAPFIQDLKKRYPEVEIALFPKMGFLQIMFQSGSIDVDQLVSLVQEKFSSFFFKEGKIEEAVHREFLLRKKTLAVAESCTGGALSAKLTQIPGASKYFLGSLVTYSNSFKKHFLKVREQTLQRVGAVSSETVVEMVQGLFTETDAQYAAAISGIAGPGGGKAEKPVGTVYIAIAERGAKLDIGLIHAPKKRLFAIEYSVNVTLAALWRLLVHKAVTFS